MRYSQGFKESILKKVLPLESKSVAGIFLYAYLVIDVWSRKIVGWVGGARGERTPAIPCSGEQQLKYLLPIPGVAQAIRGYVVNK